MGGHGHAGVVPESVLGRQGFHPEHVQRGVADTWPASSAARRASSSISGPRPGFITTAPRGSSASRSAFSGFASRGVRGSSSDHDLRPLSAPDRSPASPDRQRHTGHVAAPAAAPARDRKVQRGERLLHRPGPTRPAPARSRGVSRASGGHRPAARQASGFRQDMRVHPQMMAHRTWPTTHSTMPSVRAGSTIRHRGWVSVALPTIRSTPAHRTQDRLRART
jgi:hypothetical protein